MKTVDLEKPFTLSHDFWAAYLLLGVPVLWFARPWVWELPVFSRIAGFVFLPFAAAIICYCPFLFLRAVVRGSSNDKKIGWAFLAAVAGASLFLTAVWFFYGFASVPSRFGFAAVIIANLIFAFLHTKKPNKAPEPTPTAVTPRAMELKSETNLSNPQSFEARVAPAVGVAHL
jgi:hypothetical protein